jgi:hypothetical protein
MKKITKTVCLWALPLRYNDYNPTCTVPGVLVYNGMNGLYTWYMVFLYFIYCMASLCTPGTAVCVEEGYHFKLFTVHTEYEWFSLQQVTYRSVLYIQPVSAKIADIIIQLQSEHGRQAHPQKIHTRSTFQLADRSHSRLPAYYSML